jgi:DNA-binding Lrp family transcriptional regulator
MQKTLDAFDLKIIDALSINARLPASQIAEKVKLSRNAVRQRIERLERDGVIKGYTLRLGEGQQQGDAITAIIMVFRKDRMRGADVIQSLRRIQEVRQCYVLSGEFDLLVKLRARSQERMCEIWQQISALPGVENTTTSFALQKVIDLP